MRALRNGLRNAVGTATVVGFVVLAASAGGGCGGPKYPSCDDDEQCNADGHKGVCVDHKCVACRDDAGCGAGKVCKAGACEPVPGYCDETTTCPGGAPCTDHQCAEPVSSKPPVECDDDHPCRGPGEKCQNGHCVAPPPGGPGCRDFAPPQFAFESSDLTASSKQTLQRLAGCMTQGSLRGREVLLTGHCDDRGEYEYNMGLGAERAQRTRDFLAGLGVAAEKIHTSSRGKLDAVGTDEAGWARDRRVDIEVR